MYKSIYLVSSFVWFHKSGFGFNKTLLSTLVMKVSFYFRVDIYWFGGLNFNLCSRFKEKKFWSPK